MSRGAGEDSSSFLTVAVEHALLSPQVAERISHQMTQRGAPPEEIALEEGLLDAIEVDIVQTLLHARDTVPGYEFLGVLGRGGMGVVFRARQLNLNREVAIKTLLLSQLTHRESLARFEREAHTVGQLQHPNIVTAYDYGKHQGRLFLAMELVRGMDLGEYIQRQQRLAEGVAWQITRQIAAGLAYAERAGIVHRDIKPANVLVVRDSEYDSLAGVPLVKISDFGLSLIESAEVPRTRLTQTGRVVGTPNFMAPEQLAGEPLDCRADIYALGATVYNMLTGQPPFADYNLTQLLSRKLCESPRDVRQLNPAVSPASAELLAEMLAPDVGQRIADYPTLLARIGEITGKHAALPATGEYIAPRRNRRTGTRWVTQAAFLLAVALLAISGILAWQRRDPPPQPVLVASGQTLPLFNGQSTLGWQGLPGTTFLPEHDPEGGIALAVEDGAIVRAWKFEGDNPNYRLNVGVALAKAPVVEVQFSVRGSSALSDCLALRIENERVLLVERTAGSLRVISELPAESATVERSQHQYHSIRIERQQTHWWVYFDGQRVGTAPVAREPEPAVCRLVVESGQALFGLVEVEELVPPEK